MSSTEKLSLRGMVDREVGSGIMSVIVVDDVVTMMERMMMRGGWFVRGESPCVCVVDWMSCVCSGERCVA